MASPNERFSTGETRNAATHSRTLSNPFFASSCALLQHVEGTRGVGLTCHFCGFNLYVDNGQVMAEIVVDVAGETVAFLRGGEFLGLRGVFCQLAVGRLEVTREALGFFHGRAVRSSAPV